MEIHMEALVDLKISITQGEQAISVDASGVPATGQTGVPFSGDLVASGGDGGPYTFTDVSAEQNPPGALPDGLVCNSDGTITGTPTAVGDFDSTIQVDDQSGNTGAVTLRARTTSAKRGTNAPPRPKFDPQTGKRLN